MTIVNPTGAIKKYVDEKVSAEETARKNADSSLQTAVNGKVPTSRKVNGHALTADVTVTKSDVGLGNTDNGAKAPSTDATLASTTNPPTAKVVKDYVDGKFDGDLGTAAYKDTGTAAGNVPVLDSGGKLVASVIPAIAISEYAGNYSSKTVLPTSGYQVGDWATVSAGERPGENGAYMLTATSPSFVWTQIAKTPTEHTFGTLGGSPSDNAALQAELDKKQNQVVAGTGLALATDKKTLSIKNTVTAGTIGSATVIPKLTYNAQGQITMAESVTVYPPTTAGDNGSLWMSDGIGAGKWIRQVSDAVKTWNASVGTDNSPVSQNGLKGSLHNNQKAFIKVNSKTVTAGNGFFTLGTNSDFFACDDSLRTLFAEPIFNENAAYGTFESISVVHGCTEDDEYKIISGGFKVRSIENTSGTIKINYSSGETITGLSFVIESSIYPVDG